MDPVVLVRAEAVRVICAVCTSAVECVPSTVVEDLSERFLDKEVSFSAQEQRQNLSLFTLHIGEGGAFLQEE